MIGACRSERSSSNAVANSNEIAGKSKNSRPCSKLKTGDTGSGRLSEDGHVLKKGQASRKLGDGSRFDGNSEHIKIQDVPGDGAKKKKRKTEVMSEGYEAVHPVKDDDSEGVECVVPEKRVKKGKRKAKVKNDASEDVRIDDGSSERVEDAAPVEKSKKKWRRAEIENDGASGQLSPRKETRQGGLSDQSEGRAVKAKKVKRKKKNRRAPPEATKNTKDQCLQYLKDWQGPSWKFCKNKQLWLLSHAFEEDVIPEDDFEILLRYLEGLKGAARERLQQSANKFLENGNEDNDGDDDIDAGKYERARLILQMLD